MSSDDVRSAGADVTRAEAPVPPPWAWAAPTPTNSAAQAGAFAPAGTSYAVSHAQPALLPRPAEPEYRQWSPKQTAAAIAAAVAIACAGTVWVAWADRGSAASQTGSGVGNGGGFGSRGGFGGAGNGGFGPRDIGPGRPGGGAGQGGQVPTQSNT